jgi:hypothetical protein
MKMPLCLPQHINTILRVIDSVLEGFIHVVVCLDTVFVMSLSLETPATHLLGVIQRSAHAGLILDISRMFFGCLAVDNCAVFVLSQMHHRIKKN